MHLSPTLITILLSSLSSSLVSAETPPGFTPEAKPRLEVTFGSKPVTTPGASFTKAETSKQPTIGTTTPLNGTSYLWLMVDVDVPANFQNPSAPGPRKNNLHALITGFKPSSTPNSAGIYELKTAGSSTAAAGPITYTGPAPPAENPPHPHKYISLLFETKEGAPAITRQQVGQTFGFDVNNFVKTVGLGSPVAGNWVEVGA
ncbi:phosphatidylethanolamine-binding protein [Cladorrhinum sp. PSN259]|nr:phosphatidylethanolamine-binding protein [Cladorrhinum sp. PSN259]